MGSYHIGVAHRTQVKIKRRRSEWGESSPISCFFTVILLAAAGYGAWWFMDSQAGAVRAKGASMAAESHLSHLAESVRVGMAAGDVKAAIGEPERVEEKDDRFGLPEKWIYNQGRFEVTFQNGFVAEKRSR